MPVRRAICENGEIGNRSECEVSDRNLVGFDFKEGQGCLNYRDQVLAVSVDLGAVGGSFD